MTKKSAACAPVHRGSTTASLTATQRAALALMKRFGLKGFRDQFKTLTASAMSGGTLRNGQPAKLADKY